tara:strand:- start:1144 stop:1785 length:642 start_codon:yes stop_codon:yes gene_type:complete
MNHKVIGIRDLTASTYVLQLERNGVAFKAGQCISLGVKDHGLNREYSTYSGEHETDFEFLIKEVAGGTVSCALRCVRPGDEVTFSGPFGSFVLDAPQDLSRRYLFIGTGTGIAPFRSYVRSHPDIDWQILHGVRTLEERYDHQDYDPERYTACVSSETGGDYHGRVTTYLRENPVDPDTICYLCGNSAMLTEVFDILREQGVSGNGLFTEAFF